MKVTNALVKMFVQDQEKHGTRTALFNVLWLQASEQMSDLGVTRTRTDGPEAESRQTGKAAKAGRNGKRGAAGGREKPVRLAS